MLAEKPDLQFVGAQYIADYDIVGTLVAEFIGLFRQITAVADNYLMRVHQARDLHRNLFPTPGRTFDSSSLGHIGCHGNAQATKHLDALGYGINQFTLLPKMLVKK